MHIAEPHKLITITHLYVVPRSQYHRILKTVEHNNISSHVLSGPKPVAEPVVTRTRLYQWRQMT
jgi:hypothetical protein